MSAALKDILLFHPFHCLFIVHYFCLIKVYHLAIANKHVYLEDNE